MFTNDVCIATVFPHYYNTEYPQCRPADKSFNANATSLNVYFIEFYEISESFSFCDKNLILHIDIDT